MSDLPQWIRDLMPESFVRFVDGPYFSGRAMRRGRPAKPVAASASRLQTGRGKSTTHSARKATRRKLANASRRRNRS